MKNFILLYFEIQGEEISSIQDIQECLYAAEIS
jgi:hypothetical protein